MREKWAFTLSIALVLMFVCAINAYAGNSCPEDYAKVPLAKLMANPGDYDGCKIEVEAAMQMVVQAMVADMSKKTLPKKYKDYVLISLAGPAALAGLPKDKADIFYEIQPGTPLLMRGTVVKSSAQMKNMHGMTGSGGFLFIDLEKVEVLKKQDEAQPAAAGNDDIMAQLKKLKEMFDAGLITKEEYEAKKKDLLSKM